MKFTQEGRSSEKDEGTRKVDRKEKEKERQTWVA